ncbi:MAG TPA: hypothetical protein VNO31_15200 [Umezawaea sp.]|nr:hypothetical protein [Umezawaea sp.]
MTTTSTPWNDPARLELALRGVHKTLADEVLAEVEEHCADTGDTPEEAFGTPAVVTAEVADHRVPPVDRAKRDRGGTTVFEAWSAVIGRVGLTAVVVGVFAWFRQGFTIPLTPAGLTGVPIVYAAMMSLLYAGTIARLLGKPRTVVPAWIAAGAFVVPAACAFVLLPRDPVASMPVPTFLVVGGLLVWWAYARESSADLTKATEDAAEWLDELRGLLEGRHDVAPDRADDLARETAQRLAASDRTRVRRDARPPPARGPRVVAARHHAPLAGPRDRLHLLRDGRARRPAHLVLRHRPGRAAPVGRAADRRPAPPLTTGHGCTSTIRNHSRTPGTRSSNHVARSAATAIDSGVRRCSARYSTIDWIRSNGGG